MTRTRIVAPVLLLLLSGFGIHAAPISVLLGTLTIQTEPNAEILWEGTPLAQTNTEGTLEIGDIPPGAYTITVRKPDYESLSQTIQITATHQTQAITLTPIVVPQPEEPSGADAEIIPMPPATVLAEEEEVIQAAEPIAVTKRPAPVPAGEGEEIAAAETEIIPKPSASAPTAPTPAPSPPISNNPTTTTDPNSPLLWTALAASLILLAFTTAWLMSRRTKRRKAVAKSATPKVVLTERTPTRRDAPSFVNDLKQREDTLDTFVNAGGPRVKREVKIIDAEVVDQNEETEDDRE